MTQEQKELLLKDLCARLPYGIKVYFSGWDSEYLKQKEMVDTLYSIDSDGYCNTYEYDSLLELGNIKPYLFPLSSMTNKQKKELADICNCTIYITDWEIMFPSYEDSNMDNWQKVLDWCYKNHYDINGLIPMELANNATGLDIY